MFVDERALTVRSGDGGDGIVAWRREKRTPRGGPAGGDGGRGGDVLLRVDANLTTFADMEDLRLVRAQDGERGGPAKRHGADGADRTLGVPPGTTVYEARGGRRLRDLVEPGQTWVAARGGRGGRGNARFAHAEAQRPMHAEPGRPGRERRLRLELRVLADVGLVGLPNAGKSTLVGSLSRARPRVAGYPFTTLAPHLGLVERPDGTRFVLADLPGLIEGAHRGQGLGDRFLRHLERTRVLLHLVDLAPAAGPAPEAAWQAVRRELAAYGRGLARRPEIVAATKVDLLAPAARREALSRLAKAVDRDVYPISAVTGEGLPALLRALEACLAAAPAAPEVPARLAAPAGGGDGDAGRSPT
jgi:GTPase